VIVWMRKRVRVWLCERERELKRKKDRQSERECMFVTLCEKENKSLFVLVLYVCVSERKILCV